MIYNIAIDGPAGAGKSSIAKLVAKKLNYVYVDTGAMFRTMAYYFLTNGIDTTDENAKNVRQLILRFSMKTASSIFS